MGRHEGARYNPTRYLKPEHHGDSQYAGLLRARGRIAGMIKSLLFKRLESSIVAFRSTLGSLSPKQPELQRGSCIGLRAGRKHRNSSIGRPEL